MLSSTIWFGCFQLQIHIGKFMDHSLNASTEACEMQTQSDKYESEAGAENNKLVALCYLHILSRSINIRLDSIRFRECTCLNSAAFFTR